MAGNWKMHGLIRSTAELDKIISGSSPFAGKADLMILSALDDLSVPGKLFEYIRSGTPVLAFTTPAADHARRYTQAALSALNDEEQRAVAGNLIIRDSVVEGAIRHRSAKGTLEFEGTVDFHGTTFKDGVDLSRSVFQRMLAMDGALFEREAYFVQGHFAQGLNCAGTKFGPHTRFHRSVFRGPLDCQGSLFDGLAEFLELVCEAPVNFERARFGLGTGFSGAQFKKQANFSDAIFSREAFFAFTVFSGEARFAGAQFLQSADFSNADFKRGDDLSKVRFDQKPVTKGAKGITQEEAGSGGASTFQRYAVTLGLMLAAAFLVAFAVKLK